MQKILTLLVSALLALSVSNCSSTPDAYDYDKQKKESRDAAKDAYEEMEQY